MEPIGTQQERMQRNEDRKRRGLPHLTPDEFKAREDMLMEQESYKWDQAPRQPQAPVVPMPSVPTTPLKKQRLMVDLLREVEGGLAGEVLAGANWKNLGRTWGGATTPRDTPLRLPFPGTPLLPTKPPVA